ncbi:MAG: hypothetical protein FWE28_08885 [Oscillospiraceae bacterium]|nr:hypothetical protein [Oscillospiraceae bacterium]
MRTRKQTIFSICKGALIAIVSVGPFVLLIAIATLATFEPPPMSQEQVEEFFDSNYDALAIVAEFLANIDHRGQIEIMSSGEASATLSKRSGDMRTDLEVEDSQVLEAINTFQTFQQQLSHRTRRYQNVIRFQRDSRGEWSRYGPLFRTGVAYAVDGSDLSVQNRTDGGMHTEYIPLAIPNWFFYVIKDTSTAA